MDGIRFSTNQQQQDDSDYSPENSAGSPPSAMSHDTTCKITCPKRSRRASIQKRVVSVPISDGDGSRLKGEISFPPSDSWAWRKYGQKPIKGSPYPRGYYRCSSSKGCPAKKQVERSRVDPNMLVVTYSCEHNHPWPAAAARSIHTNGHHRNATFLNNNATVTPPKTGSAPSSPKVIRDGFSAQPEVESDEKFAHLGGDDDKFGWFSSFEPTTSAVTESSILTEAELITYTTDMPLIFSMGEEEEEESLFADLGELPECSREFGLGIMERDETRRRQNLTPWCGTA